MKVLTIKQPWATLIALGYKKYEFRSWKTNYVGEFYIHAGKAVDKEAMKKFNYLNLNYPTSKIIAKVTLEKCIKLDSAICTSINKENNLIYGNKIREGYAWKLKNVELINCEKEVKGQLGLWNINI